MSNSLFQPNYQQISYEDFGDEIVVVKLDSGIYYSLNPSGVEIWRLLEKQASHQDVYDWLSARYSSDLQTIQDLCAEFFQALQAEQLVIIAENSDSQNAEISTAEPTGQPLIKPELNCYTDMQNLLLIDPIHEVDETGWPIATEEPIAANQFVDSRPAEKSAS